MMYSPGNLDNPWWIVAKNWMTRKIFPLLSLHHDMYVVLCVDRRANDSRANFSNEPRIFIANKRREKTAPLDTDTIIYDKQFLTKAEHLRQKSPNSSYNSITREAIGRHEIIDSHNWRYRYFVPQLYEAIIQSLGEAVDEYLEPHQPRGRWTFVFDNWVPEVFHSVQHVCNLQTGQITHNKVPEADDVWIQKPMRVYEGDLMMAEWAHLWARRSNDPITLSSVDGDVWLVAAGFLVTCPKAYTADVHVIHLPGGSTETAIREGRELYNPGELGDGFERVVSENVALEKSPIIIQDLRSMQMVINTSMEQMYTINNTTAGWLDTFKAQNDSQANTVDWFIEYIALLAFHSNDYIPARNGLRFLPPSYAHFLNRRRPLPPIVFRHPKNPNRFMVNFRGLVHLAFEADNRPPVQKIDWSTANLFWIHRNMEFVLHYFILDPIKVQTRMTALDSHGVPMYGYYYQKGLDANYDTILNMHDTTRANQY